MKCLHCNKPIVKYPAFSQHDPTWVHEFEGMPWGSEYCEGSNPYERTANTVATPSSAGCGGFNADDAKREVA